MLWMRRKEVSDYSRTYLSLISLLSAIGLVVSILGIFFGNRFFRSWSLLDPMKSLGGLPIITLFLSYALEVMRPRQLRGSRLLMLWLPSIIGWCTVQAVAYMDRPEESSAGMGCVIPFAERRLPVCIFHPFALYSL